MAIPFQEIQQFVFTAVYVESSEKIEDSWHGLLQLTLQLEKDAASFLRKVKISIAESLQEEILISIKIELR